VALDAAAPAGPDVLGDPVDIARAGQKRIVVLCVTDVPAGWW
jgi:hypothetical protein